MIIIRKILAGGGKLSAALRQPGQTVEMTLSELPAFTAATVVEVRDANEGDAIGRRLRELGFVRGEPVKVVGKGFLGSDPLLIQIGFTRFALRRAEAARVQVETVSAERA